MSLAKRNWKVAITTGDSDGIGSEVTSKALHKLSPKKPIQFFIWRSKSRPLADVLRLRRSAFSYQKVSCWQEALKVPSKYNLIDIASNISPVQWVEQSILAAEKGFLDALVTAPLSKGLIQQSGFSDKGHTDILRRVSGKQDLFMSFVGSQFAIVLLTDHIAVCDVPQKLSIQRISKGLFCADDLQKAFFKKPKPIGLLGLNPHAGEGGVIGNEEQKLFLPAMQAVQDKIPIDGLLVPDVAFQEQNRKKHNIFVASYHDQGLIPFKSLHKSYTGVQVTWGLSFVRTSVDHGTAKDIFGKNKANPQSMIHAIQVALQLLRTQQKT